jgi:hypothetical protein
MLLLKKSALAQTPTSFQEAHKQLLADYILFIDSVEKKTTTQQEFDVRAQRHLSKITFIDDKYEYQLTKKVHVYSSGIRYEKIDWRIRKAHQLWFRKKLYEIKQVGHNYRFIEKIDYDFTAKLKPKKITSSFDDNYLLIKELHAKHKENTYFFVKPTSSVPLLHQD